MKTRIRNILAVGASAIPAAIIIASACINFHVREISIPFIYQSAAGAEKRGTAIVLGARVYDNGVMSHALEDRMETALELYRAGRIKKILISGKRSGGPDDEVAAMKGFLMKRGVRGRDIMIDGRGVNTAVSMQRAAGKYSIKEAVVVTQRYHLYRAVMLARKNGIDAAGCPADRRRYKKIIWFTFREFFATVKDHICSETCSFP